MVAVGAAVAVGAVRAAVAAVAAVAAAEVRSLAWVRAVEYARAQSMVDSQPPEKLKYEFALAPMRNAASSTQSGASWRPS